MEELLKTNLTREPGYFYFCKQVNGMVRVCRAKLGRPKGTKSKNTLGKIFGFRVARDDSVKTIRLPSKVIDFLKEKDKLFFELIQEEDQVKETRDSENLKHDEGRVWTKESQDKVVKENIDKSIQDRQAFDEIKEPEEKPIMGELSKEEPEKLIKNWVCYKCGYKLPAVKGLLNPICPKCSKELSLS